MIILSILMMVLFFRIMFALLRASWRILGAIIGIVGVAALIYLAGYAIPIMGLFLLPVIAGGLIIALVIYLVRQSETRT